MFCVKFRSNNNRTGRNRKCIQYTNMYCVTSLEFHKAESAFRTLKFFQYFECPFFKHPLTYRQLEKEFLESKSICLLCSIAVQLFYQSQNNFKKSPQKFRLLKYLHLILINTCRIFTCLERS